jgi:hypothetical protein
MKLFNQYKAHNIYIIKTYSKIGNSIIKVGFSNNLEERLKSYYYHNPYFEIITTCFILEGKIWEEEFHRKHKSTLLNEWYNEEFLSYILNDLNINNADFLLPELQEEFNIDLISKNSTVDLVVQDYILNRFTKYNYSYSELLILFNDLNLNGNKIKCLLPKFSKHRKIINKIRETYYNFMIQ